MIVRPKVRKTRVVKITKPFHANIHIMIQIYEPSESPPLPDQH